jgi:hypothetical protein
MPSSFFETERFNFEFQLALGAVRSGCGDVGEMFATRDRIRDGDAQSWCEEWTATAERIRAIAQGCQASGHVVSAREAFLRASAYYALVLSSVDGTDDPAGWLLPTFRAHRHCFNAYVSLLDPPGRRVEIPYEGMTLPGCLFGHDGADRQRPTLILNNGSDGPITSLWPALGAGVFVRGYNVLVFDGPGQQSMLLERNVPFRHDWEHVITPVVDWLCSQPNVDASKCAIYGISQGGYWVPRALAFEHRLAAGIVDPGVYDAFEPWYRALPEPLRHALDAADRDTFDELMNRGLAQAPAEERQNWAWRAKPYGMTSPYDVFVEARRYTLAGLTDQIACPMLIADPEGEQFWPGQSRRLYDALPGPKKLVPFTAREGADRHCEPLARSLFEQRALDWLDETLA